MKRKQLQQAAEVLRDAQLAAQHLAVVQYERAERVTESDKGEQQ